MSGGSDRVTERSWAALFVAATIFIAPMAGPMASAAPRYPSDLALDPSGPWIYTANEESGSVSVLDLESGLVTDELALDPLGRPGAIAASDTGEGGILVAVAETFAHRVALIRAGSRAGRERPLGLLGRVDVGRLPADLLFTRGRLLVACEGEDEVQEIDVASLQVVRRIAAVEGARRLAILDGTGVSLGSRLAAAGRTAVCEIDLDRGRLLFTREVAGGAARNIDGLAGREGSVYLAHQVQPTEAPTDPQMIEWGLILTNRVTVLSSLSTFLSPAAGGPAASRREVAYGVSVDADAAGERVIALDLRRRAAGDPGRAALVPGKELFLVPSAGTGRLLFVDVSAAFLGQPLSSDVPVPGIRIGARPLSVRATKDGEKAYVACYLDDEVVEVSIAGRRVLRSLRLGAAAPETPERRGAGVFFDADRSRGGWYSCQSCHPGGGTAGHSFNTLSDGRGLAKRSPDLRGTAETGPWSWLGRFGRLEEQVAASLRKTMAVDHEASPEDVQDVTAYIRSLPRPLPSRTGEELGGDPSRGARVFDAAGCRGCHAPPAFTSPGLHDLGLEDRISPDARYNPPSLRGARDRRRYLHDGRAATLASIFREHDAAGRHGKGASLAERDLEDLVAFLKTL